MALPVELGIVESATLTRGFITEQLTDAGMVCSYSIHNKRGNPHVHIMATLRGIEITGDDTDPIRFGNKNRDWNSKAMLGQWRKAWADHVNAALVKAGSDQRVTHQSFAALGRQNEPTVHVGPDFKKGDGYQAKRTARLQSNEQVTSRNKQRGEQRRHAAHQALMAGVCGAKLSVALKGQTHREAPAPEQKQAMPQTLEQAMAHALAPVHHLIDDMAALLHQVQTVAHALERPLSSGALAKRVARILGAVPPPQNQFELQTSLVAMEVVFAAKRRPEFVAAVLDAVPAQQRQHFENIVASVLGATPIDAGHDLAALADFTKVVPAWFEVGKPEPLAEPERHAKTYPLGAYDPTSEQTLVVALNLHRELQPIPVPDAPKVADVMADADADANIWGGMPAGPVLAPQPIRTREVNNPWGITPDEAGDGIQPFFGSSGPTGWKPNRSRFYRSGVTWLRQETPSPKAGDNIQPALQPVCIA